MDILLADDHALVRDGMIPFLERVEPGTRVIEAATFADAMAMARTTPGLGLAILDLCMPGMDGLSGFSTMKAEFPNLPILILSGSIKHEDATQAMELGASGYIPKTMRGETIIGVLRLVLAGEKYVPPFLFESRPPASHSQPPPHPLSQLTPRECDILDLVVDGAPNKVIARMLSLQEVTVKAHLRNMFRKLGVANRTEAARVAMVAGMTGRNTKPR